MTGNRKLDALVNRWAFQSEIPPDSEKPSEISSRLTHKSGLWWWSWNKTDYGWHPRCYTSDASASEALLEKMREKGFHYREYRSASDCIAPVHVWFLRKGTNPDDAPYSSAGKGVFLNRSVGALRAIGCPEEQIQEALKP